MSSDFFKKVVATFAILLVAANALMGQFYLTGEDPSGVKWKRVNSGNYKVIYPAGADSMAFRYITLLEQYRPFVMAGLKVNPKPVPVILHPFTTRSNGMVTWAPKRMELYTTPPAGGGYPQRWDEQLAVHESRHVGQMSIFTKGIYKPLGWLLGEQITGLGIGVYTSKWLLEGDAVIAETELTASGRGRSAAFLEYYRTSFLNGDYRSWSRWRFGSNKYYTPDHYALGYMVISAGRAKSESYTYTGDLMGYYVRRFYNPDIKNYAHKKITGLSLKQLAKESFKYHTELWKDEYNARGNYDSSRQIVGKRSRYYTQFISTAPVNADTLLSVRRAYDRASELVMLGTDSLFLARHPSGVKRLRPFSSSAGRLEVVGNKVYYIETVGDKRWDLAAYNDLFVYDLESGKIKRLTHKRAYYDPSANSTSDKLAVVEYPNFGGSRIVILDMAGSELHSLTAPENGQLTEVEWSGNGLYALAITERGMGIYHISLCGKESEWVSVLNSGYRNISNLGVEGDVIYFDSDVSGVNSLYAYDVEMQQLSSIAKAPFSATNPQLYGDRLFYSNLDLGGYYPVYAPYKPTSASGEDAGLSGTINVEVSEGILKSNYDYPVAQMLSSQAKSYFKSRDLLPDSCSSIVLDSLEYKRKYHSRPYRKGLHLFRIHSWGPVYYNVDKITQGSYDKWYDAVSLGATIYSQNTQGTAVSMLGYSYRSGFHAAHASFEYSGWMPVFKVEAHFNHDHRIICKVVEAGDTKLVDAKESSDPLFELKVRSYLPLYFNSRGWQRGFIPQLLWKYDNHKFYTAKKDDYKSRNQLSFSAQYYQMRPVATAAIFPRWGFNVAFSGAVSPAGAENFGSVYAANAYFYLPGLDVKQGLKLSAAYQYQDTDGKYYYLDNLVGMPRGFEDQYAPNYFKVSADYAIPVNFKGADLGFLGYYKRLQIIPFADYARLKDDKGSIALKSFGADLLVDGYLFKIGVPLSIGVRYARTNNPQERNHVALLFSASLY